MNYPSRPSSWASLLFKSKRSGIDACGSSGGRLGTAGPPLLPRCAFSCLSSSTSFSCSCIVLNSLCLHRRRRRLFLPCLTSSFSSSSPTSFYSDVSSLVHFYGTEGHDGKNKSNKSVQGRGTRRNAGRSPLLGGEERHSAQVRYASFYSLNQTHSSSATATSARMMPCVEDGAPPYLRPQHGNFHIRFSLLRRANLLMDTLLLSPSSSSPLLLLPSSSSSSSNPFISIPGGEKTTREEKRGGEKEAKPHAQDQNTNSRKAEAILKTLVVSLFSKAIASLSAIAHITSLVPVHRIPTQLVPLPPSVPLLSSSVSSTDTKDEEEKEEGKIKKKGGKEESKGIVGTPFFTSVVHSWWKYLDHSFSMNHLTSLPPSSTPSSSFLTAWKVFGSIFTATRDTLSQSIPGHIPITLFLRQGEEEEELLLEEEQEEEDLQKRKAMERSRARRASAGESERDSDKEAFSSSFCPFRSTSSLSNYPRQSRLSSPPSFIAYHQLTGVLLSLSTPLSTQARTMEHLLPLSWLRRSFLRLCFCEACEEGKREREEDEVKQEPSSPPPPPQEEEERRERTNKKDLEWVQKMLTQWNTWLAMDPPPPPRPRSSASSSSSSFFSSLGTGRNYHPHRTTREYLYRRLVHQLEHLVLSLYLLSSLEKTLKAKIKKEHERRKSSSCSSAACHHVAYQRQQLLLQHLLVQLMQKEKFVVLVASTAAAEDDGLSASFSFLQGEVDVVRKRFSGIPALVRFLIPYLGQLQQEEEIAQRRPHPTGTDFSCGSAVGVPVPSPGEGLVEKTKGETSAFSSPSPHTPHITSTTPTPTTAIIPSIRRTLSAWGRLLREFLQALLHEVYGMLPSLTKVGGVHPAPTSSLSSSSSSSSLFLVCPAVAFLEAVGEAWTKSIPLLEMNEIRLPFAIWWLQSIPPLLHAFSALVEREEEEEGGRREEAHRAGVLAALEGREKGEKSHSLLSSLPPHATHAQQQLLHVLSEIGYLARRLLHYDLQQYEYFLRHGHAGHPREHHHHYRHNAEYTTSADDKKMNRNNLQEYTAGGLEGKEENHMEVSDLLRSEDGLPLPLAALRHASRRGRRSLFLDAGAKGMRKDWKRGGGEEFVIDLDDDGDNEEEDWGGRDREGRKRHDKEEHMMVMMMRRRRVGRGEAQDASFPLHSQPGSSGRMEGKRKNKKSPHDRLHGFVDREGEKEEKEADEIIKTMTNTPLEQDFSLPPPPTSTSSGSEDNGWSESIEEDIECIFDCSRNERRLNNTEAESEREGRAGFRWGEGGKRSSSDVRALDKSGGGGGDEDDRPSSSPSSRFLHRRAPPSSRDWIQRARKEEGGEEKRRRREEQGGGGGGGMGLFVDEKRDVLMERSASSSPLVGHSILFQLFGLDILPVHPGGGGSTVEYYTSSSSSSSPPTVASQHPSLVALLQAYSLDVAQRDVALEDTWSSMILAVHRLSHILLSRPASTSNSNASSSSFSSFPSLVIAFAVFPLSVLESAQRVVIGLGTLLLHLEMLAEEEETIIRRLRQQRARELALFSPFSSSLSSSTSSSAFSSSPFSLSGMGESVSRSTTALLQPARHREWLRHRRFLQFILQVGVEGLYHQTCRAEQLWSFYALRRPPASLWWHNNNNNTSSGCCSGTQSGGVGSVDGGLFAAPSLLPTFSTTRFGKNSKASSEEDEGENANTALSPVTPRLMLSSIIGMSMEAVDSSVAILFTRDLQTAVTLRSYSDYDRHGTPSSALRKRRGERTVEHQGRNPVFPPPPRGKRSEEDKEAEELLSILSAARDTKRALEYFVWRKCSGEESQARGGEAEREEEKKSTPTKGKENVEKEGEAGGSASASPSPPLFPFSLRGLPRTPFTSHCLLLVLLTQIKQLAVVLSRSRHRYYHSSSFLWSSASFSGNPTAEPNTATSLPSPSSLFLFLLEILASDAALFLLCGTSAGFLDELCEVHLRLGLPREWLYRFGTEVLLPTLLPCIITGLHHSSRKCEQQQEMLLQRYVEAQQFQEEEDGGSEEEEEEDVEEGVRKGGGGRDGKNNTNKKQAGEPQKGEIASSSEKNPPNAPARTTRRSGGVGKEGEGDSGWNDRDLPRFHSSSSSLFPPPLRSSPSFIYHAVSHGEDCEAVLFLLAELSRFTGTTFTTSATSTSSAQAQHYKDILMRLSVYCLTHSYRGGLQRGVGGGGENQESGMMVNSSSSCFSSFWMKKGEEEAHPSSSSSPSSPPALQKEKRNIQTDIPWQSGSSIQELLHMLPGEEEEEEWVTRGEGPSNANQKEEKERVKENTKQNNLFSSGRAFPSPPSRQEIQKVLQDLFFFLPKNQQDSFTTTMGESAPPSPFLLLLRVGELHNTFLFRSRLGFLSGQGWGSAGVEEEVAVGGGGLMDGARGGRKSTNNHNNNCYSRPGRIPAASALEAYCQTALSGSMRFDEVRRVFRRGKGGGSRNRFPVTSFSSHYYYPPRAGGGGGGDVLFRSVLEGNAEYGYSPLSLVNAALARLSAIEAPTTTRTNRTSSTSPDAAGDADAPLSLLVLPFTRAASTSKISPTFSSLDKKGETEGEEKRREKEKRQQEEQKTEWDRQHTEKMKRRVLTLFVSQHQRAVQAWARASLDGPAYEAVRRHRPFFAAHPTSASLLGYLVRFMEHYLREAERRRGKWWRWWNHGTSMGVRMMEDPTTTTTASTASTSSTSRTSSKILVENKKADGAAAVMNTEWNNDGGGARPTTERASSLALPPPPTSLLLTEAMQVSMHDGSAPLLSLLGSLTGSFGGSPGQEQPHRAGSWRTLYWVLNAVDIVVRLYSFMGPAVMNTSHMVRRVHNAPSLLSLSSGVMEKDDGVGADGGKDGAGMLFSPRLFNMGQEDALLQNEQRQRAAVRLLAEEVLPSSSSGSSRPHRSDSSDQGNSSHNSRWQRRRRHGSLRHVPMPILAMAVSALRSQLKALPPPPSISPSISSSSFSLMDSSVKNTPLKDAHKEKVGEQEQVDGIHTCSTSSSASAASGTTTSSSLSPALVIGGEEREAVNHTKKNVSQEWGVFSYVLPTNFPKCWSTLSDAMASMEDENNREYTLLGLPRHSKLSGLLLASSSSFCCPSSAGGAGAAGTMITGSGGEITTTAASSSPSSSAFVLPSSSCAGGGGGMALAGAEQEEVGSVLIFAIKHAALHLKAAMVPFQSPPLQLLAWFTEKEKEKGGDASLWWSSPPSDSRSRTGVKENDVHDVANYDTTELSGRDSDDDLLATRGGRETEEEALFSSGYLKEHEDTERREKDEKDGSIIGNSSSSSMTDEEEEKDEKRKKRHDVDKDQEHQEQEQLLHRQRLQQLASYYFSIPALLFSSSSSSSGTTTSTPLFSNSTSHVQGGGKEDNENKRKDEAKKGENHPLGEEEDLLRVAVDEKGKEKGGFSSSAYPALHPHSFRPSSSSILLPPSCVEFRQSLVSLVCAVDAAVQWGRTWQPTSRPPPNTPPSSSSEHLLCAIMGAKSLCTMVEEGIIPVMHACVDLFGHWGVGRGKKKNEKEEKEKECQRHPSSATKTNRSTTMLTTTITPEMDPQNNNNNNNNVGVSSHLPFPFPSRLEEDAAALLWAGLSLTAILANAAAVSSPIPTPPPLTMTTGEGEKEEDDLKSQATSSSLGDSGTPHPRRSTTTGGGEDSLFSKAAERCLAGLRRALREILFCVQQQQEQEEDLSSLHPKKLSLVTSSSSSSSSSTWLLPLLTRGIHLFQSDPEISRSCLLRLGVDAFVTLEHIQNELSLVLVDEEKENTPSSSSSIPPPSSTTAQRKGKKKKNSKEEEQVEEVPFPPCPALISPSRPAHFLSSFEVPVDVNMTMAAVLCLCRTVLCHSPSATFFYHSIFRPLQYPPSLRSSSRVASSMLLLSKGGGEGAGAPTTTRSCCSLIVTSKARLQSILESFAELQHPEKEEEEIVKEGEEKTRKRIDMDEEAGCTSLNGKRRKKRGGGEGISSVICTSTSSTPPPMTWRWIRWSCAVKEWISHVSEVPWEVLLSSSSSSRRARGDVQLGEEEDRSLLLDDDDESGEGGGRHQQESPFIPAAGTSGGMKQWRQQQKQQQDRLDLFYNIEEDCKGEGWEWDMQEEVGVGVGEEIVEDGSRPRHSRTAVGATATTTETTTAPGSGGGSRTPGAFPTLSPFSSSSSSMLLWDWLGSHEEEVIERVIHRQGRQVIFFYKSSSSSSVSPQNGRGGGGALMGKKEEHEMKEEEEEPAWIFLKNISLLLDRFPLATILVPPHPHWREGKTGEEVDGETADAPPSNPISSTFTRSRSSSSPTSPSLPSSAGVTVPRRGSSLFSTLLALHQKYYYAHYAPRNRHEKQQPHASSYASRHLSILLSTIWKKLAEKWRRELLDPREEAFAAAQEELQGYIQQFRFHEDVMEVGGGGGAGILTSGMGSSDVAAMNLYHHHHPHINGGNGGGRRRWKDLFQLDITEKGDGRGIVPSFSSHVKTASKESSCGDGVVVEEDATPPSNSSPLPLFLSSASFRIISGLISGENSAAPRHDDIRTILVGVEQKRQSAAASTGVSAAGAAAPTSPSIKQETQKKRKKQLQATRQALRKCLQPIILHRDTPAGGRSGADTGVSSSSTTTTTTTAKTTSLRLAKDAQDHWGMVSAMGGIHQDIPLIVLVPLLAMLSRARGAFFMESQGRGGGGGGGIPPLHDNNNDDDEDNKKSSSSFLHPLIDLAEVMITYFMREYVSLRPRLDGNNMNIAWVLWGSGRGGGVNARDMDVCHSHPSMAKEEHDALRRWVAQRRPWREERELVLQHTLQDAGVPTAALLSLPPPPPSVREAITLHHHKERNTRRLWNHSQQPQEEQEHASDSCLLFPPRLSRALDVLLRIQQAPFFFSSTFVSKREEQKEKGRWRQPLQQQGGNVKDKKPVSSFDLDVWMLEYMRDGIFYLHCLTLVVSVCSHFGLLHERGRASLEEAVPPASTTPDTAMSNNRSNANWSRRRGGGKYIPREYLLEEALLHWLNVSGNLARHADSLCHLAMDMATDDPRVVFSTRTTSTTTTNHHHPHEHPLKIKNNHKKKTALKRRHEFFLRLQVVEPIRQMVAAALRASLLVLLPLADTHVRTLPLLQHVLLNLFAGFSVDSLLPGIAKQYQQQHVENASSSSSSSPPPVPPLFQAIWWLEREESLTSSWSPTGGRDDSSSEGAGRGIYPSSNSTTTTTSTSSGRRTSSSSRSTTGYPNTVMIRHHYPTCSPTILAVFGTTPSFITALAPFLRVLSFSPIAAVISAALTSSLLHYPHASFIPSPPPSTVSPSNHTTTSMWISSSSRGPPIAPYLLAATELVSTSTSYPSWAARFVSIRLLCHTLVQLFLFANATPQEAAAAAAAAAAASSPTSTIRAHRQRSSPSSRGGSNNHMRGDPSSSLRQGKKREGGGEEASGGGDSILKAEMEVVEGEDDEEDFPLLEAVLATAQRSSAFSSSSSSSASSVSLPYRPELMRGLRMIDLATTNPNFIPHEVLLTFLAVVARVDVQVPPPALTALLQLALNARPSLFGQPPIHRPTSNRALSSAFTMKKKRRLPAGGAPSSSPPPVDGNSGGARYHHAGGPAAVSSSSSILSGGGGGGGGLPGRNRHPLLLSCLQEKKQNKAAAVGWEKLLADTQGGRGVDGQMKMTMLEGFTLSDVVHDNNHHHNQDDDEEEEEGEEGLSTAMKKAMMMMMRTEGEGRGGNGGRGRWPSSHAETLAQLQWTVPGMVELGMHIIMMRRLSVEEWKRAQGAIKAADDERRERVIRVLSLFPSSSASSSSSSSSLLLVLPSYVRAGSSSRNGEGSEGVVVVGENGKNMEKRGGKEKDENLVEEGGKDVSNTATTTITTPPPPPPHCYDEEDNNRKMVQRMMEASRLDVSPHLDKDDLAGALGVALLHLRYALRKAFHSSLRKVAPRLNPSLLADVVEVVAAVEGGGSGGGGGVDPNKKHRARSWARSLTNVPEFLTSDNNNNTSSFSHHPHHVSLPSFQWTTMSGRRGSGSSAEDVDVVGGKEGDPYRSPPSSHLLFHPPRRFSSHSAPCSLFLPPSLSTLDCFPPPVDAVARGTMRILLHRAVVCARSIERQLPLLLPASSPTAIPARTSGGSRTATGEATTDATTSLLDAEGRGAVKDAAPSQHHQEKEEEEENEMEVLVLTPRGKRRVARLMSALHRRRRQQF